MGQLELSMKNMFRSMLEGRDSLYSEMSFKMVRSHCASVYFGPTFCDDIGQSRFLVLKNKFSKCATEFLCICEALADFAGYP